MKSKNPLCESVLTINEGHAHRLRWSPNGRYLAAPLNTGRIQIWDLVTKETGLFGDHRSALYNIAWSPDSRRLATCSYDGRVTVLDLLTRKTQTLPNIPPYQWFDLSWSPKIETLGIASSQGQTLIFDLKKEKATALFEIEDSINAISWSHNALGLAICYERSGIAIHTESGDLLESIDTKVPSLHCTWSPKQPLLVLAQNDGLHVWSTESWTKNSHHDPERAYQALSFSHDGQYLGALTKEGELKILWSKDWSCMATIDTQTLSRWQGLHFHPKKAMLAVPDKKGTRIALWDFSDTAPYSKSKSVKPKRCASCPPLPFKPFSDTSQDTSPWTLDTSMRTLQRNGKKVSLTALEQKAFIILDRCFHSDPDKRLTCHSISETINGQFRPLLAGKKGHGLRFKLKALKLDIEGGSNRNPGYRLIDKEC